jgi:hypothetical protein
LWYDASAATWKVTTDTGTTAQGNVSYLGHRVQCWVACQLYEDSGTKARILMSVGGDDFESDADSPGSGWATVATVAANAGLRNATVRRHLGDSSRASQMPMTLTGDWLVLGTLDADDLNAELPGLVRSLDDRLIAGRRVV